MGLDFLGRVPLAMDIRVASDAGEPPAGGESIEGRAFAGIAAQLKVWLENRAGKRTNQQSVQQSE